MDYANILLSLAGDDGNTVPMIAVSAAEIALLSAIHGEAAVNEIEPCAAPADAEPHNRAELRRLREKYGRAKDDNDTAIVDVLYPGAAARVFETLDELGIDESFYKAEARVKAAPVKKAEAPKPRGKAKAEASAPVVEDAPAADTEDDDGVRDMPDVMA